MYIVDDPTLALLVRFAGGDRSLNLSDAEFLFKQLEAIEEYVSHYSAEERQARAMESVSYTHLDVYKRQYRRRFVFPRANRSSWKRWRPERKFMSARPNLTNRPVLHGPLKRRRPR